ncbi:DUF4169 family protein, partial [Mesorhizobium sp. M7A.F.Ca.US.007.01.1.1]
MPPPRAPKWSRSAPSARNRPATYAVAEIVNLRQARKQKARDEKLRAAE